MSKLMKFPREACAYLQKKQIPPNDIIDALEAIWDEAVEELRGKVSDLTEMAGDEVREEVLALLDKPKMYKRKVCDFPDAPHGPNNTGCYEQSLNTREGERREDAGRRACFSRPFGRRGYEQRDSWKGSDIGYPKYDRREFDKDRRGPTSNH